MTNTTMTRTLRYGKGYTGKLGSKCWVARITGTDQAYGLAREFLEPVAVEREHFSRPRTMVNLSFNLEVNGLYELSAEGDRWFAACVRTADGGVKATKVSEARVRTWAEALDAGLSDNDARLASKGV